MLISVDDMRGIEGRDEHFPRKFMVAADASLRIKSKSQFLRWTLGELQEIFPHEVTISSLNDAANKTIYKDTFCDIHLGDEALHDVVCRDDSVLNRLIRGWKKNLVPCWIDEGRKNDDEDIDILRTLKDHGFDNAVSHGMHDVNGDVMSFFVFLRVSRNVEPHHAYLLEMLIPYMHGALIRALVHDERSGVKKKFSHDLITEREKEILKWLGIGKSNWEIAVILSVSPFTVKNHVFKIMKKLHVQNRWHAVARAAELDIL